MKFVSVTFLLVAAGFAQTPADSPPGHTPLPGKGLAQHPFLYCGEWQNRSTSNQVMYIVRGGRIAWSYTNPLKGSWVTAACSQTATFSFRDSVERSKSPPIKRSF